MMPVEWMDVTVVVCHLNRFIYDNWDISPLVRHHVWDQSSHQIKGVQGFHAFRKAGFVCRLGSAKRALLIPTISPDCGLHALESQTILLCYALTSAFCHWPRWIGSARVYMRGWAGAKRCEARRPVAQPQPPRRRRLIFSLVTQPRRSKQRPPPPRS